jgi:hypothetical protein
LLKDWEFAGERFIYNSTYKHDNYKLAEHKPPTTVKSALFRDLNNTSLGTCEFVDPEESNHLYMTNFYKNQRTRELKVYNDNYAPSTHTKAYLLPPITGISIYLEETQPSFYVKHLSLNLFK